MFLFQQLYSYNSSPNQLKMFNKDNTSYLQYSALITIIIIATLLRLLKLNYQSLWLDEIYSIVPADPKWPESMIIEYCKKDQPPTYFLSLHYWFKIFPYTDFYGRLFSAFTGILGVLSMFFLGKQFKDINTGLIASFVTAINYFHIYYSQEVRFYSLLFLLTVLSYLFFLRCCKNSTIINYLVYIIVSTALVYTHYYGILILVTQLILFIMLVWKSITNWKFIIYSILAGIIITILYIPWIPIIIKDSNIDPNLMWILPPKELFIFEYLYNYFGKDPYQLILFFICLFLVIKAIFFKNKDDLQLKRKTIIVYFIIFISILLILIIGIPHLRAVVPHSYVHTPLAMIYLILASLFIIKLPTKLFSNTKIELQTIGQNDKVTFLILAVWGIVSYLIPYTRSLLSTPMLLERYTMISLPVIFMFIALGLYQVKNSKVRISLIGLLILSSSLNFVFFNEYYTSYHKGQFREAAKLVIQKNKNQTKVYSTLAWHFNFYFDQFNADIDVIDPNSLDFANSISTEKKLWVLIGHGVPLTDEQNKLIEKDFLLKNKHSYYGKAYAVEYIRK